MAREIPLFSFARAKILSTLKKNEPMTIDSLAKKSGMSRASVYNHLRTLEARGLIHKEQKLKDKGQPVFITTNKADPINLNVLKMFEKLFPELFEK